MTAANAMQNHGRIVACGMVSQYILLDPEKYPLRNIIQIVTKRITMRGFIVRDSDMGPKYGICERAPGECAEFPDDFTRC